MQMSRTVWGLVLGSLMSGAIGGLRQDIMGKEAWVRSVDANWMPAVWSVPLNIGLLVVVGVALVFMVRSEIEEASK